nr:cytidylate kinase family protein [Hyphomicrobium sp. CS1GBMeth3]
MTREMGTRGGDVAAGVAERLGLTVIHHELVEHDIAERAGLSESDVHRLLEGEASLWERWKLDRTSVSRCTAQEIIELAARGNILIRGWGATHLLKDIPHVICVRITAPMVFREQVVMNRLGFVDAMRARREIERSDAAHNGTMQQLFGIDHWSEAENYALVLNTARVPVAACVAHIAELAEEEAFCETELSRSALIDQLILARARQAMDQRFGSKSLQNGFEVNVCNGKVLLSGGSTDEKMIVDAIRLLQGVKGVTGVESKVAYVAFVPHAATQDQSISRAAPQGQGPT